MARNSFSLRIVPLTIALLPCCFGSAECLEEIAGQKPATAEAERASRGYSLLVDTPLLKSDFTQEVFDNLWQVWPKALSEHARSASPDVRRKMAFSRYGLTPRADNPEKPLQYVVDASGNWTMNCFACHGGTVYGLSLIHI